MQSDPTDAHNDYLELLGDYGLIGALLFLIFFLRIFVTVGGLLRIGPTTAAAGTLAL